MRTLLATDRIDIFSYLESDKNYIDFVFKGYFDTEASQMAAHAWKKMFDEHPEKHFCLRWNCNSMNGFDPEARKQWYAVLKGNKDRINEIEVVARSIIIRAAAKVMLNVFGIKAKIMRSSEESVQGYELVK